MKKWFVKWLSALLIAALLLSGAVIAEDTSVIEEIPAAEDEIEVSVELEEAEIAETEAALEADVELEVPAEEAVETSEPLFAMEDAETVIEEAEESSKLMAAAGDIPVDAAHFPDAGFRLFLSTKVAPSGYLSAEALNRTEILQLYENLQELYGDGALQGYGITSLQGIEYFPNLKRLDCQRNPIASLDVSMLKNLEVLCCVNCSMTSLNVNGCTSLRELYINDNALTTVDLSGCPNFAGFPKSFKKAKFKQDSKGRVTAYQYYNSNGASLHCDAKLKFGSASAAAPAVAASFVEVAGKVPATVAVDPASTAKNTKATALAAPGSAMQLNLGGAAGKKFKSSKKKVATVSKNGVVTFKKGGKVKITYKVGKQTRKVTLTVIDPTMPKAVALNQTGTVAAKVGDAVTLTATMNEGAVSAIKWKTSNKKVATVKNGVVTFKKAGKVTITAVTKRGKKKAKVTYTVAKQ